MQTLNISDLPESLQTLLHQIAETGEAISITDGDRPLAIISPTTKPKRAAFGSAKGTGKIIGDIVEPTSNLVTWDVLS
ncbi:hypothetical protein PJF56_01455 [Roseofilum sp. BLCC_M91]|uniref:Prevent-host-death family protein n=1 Tax=Roseofilum halophilum BLCC-M91 TaxID=3022259 RepID=A0ABT7BEC6_9CYAN|nr:hypothetical protein [Roseofilum halophilum]MDJ1177519.1 hypothetical protein [Roseofilum halophilum BLCC-M91]